MAKPLSTNLLLESVKRRASLPTTQITFQEEDFLAFANEELDIGVVPHVLSYHEDYLLFTEDVPLEDNSSRYLIPNRAVGNKLREVSYVDNSGTVYEMTRIFIEDLPYFQYGLLGGSSGPLKAFYTEGDSLVVLPEYDKSAGGALRMSYYMRPNALVSEDEIAKVSSFDYKNGVIKLNAIPLSFASQPQFDITSSKSPYKLLAKDLAPNAQSGTTFTYGTQQIYTIKGVLPAAIVDSSYIAVVDNTVIPSVSRSYWFDKTGSSPAPAITNTTLVRVDISAAVTADDVAIALNTPIAAYSPTYLPSTILADTITLSNGGNGISVGNNFQVNDANTGLIVTLVQQGTNTMPRNLNVGDIVARPEETIIPQVPIELHSMLAQRVALRCLEALGDQNGLQAGMLKLAEMEQKTGSLIDNRVEGAPLKVSPKHTFLRRGRNYARR